MLSRNPNCNQRIKITFCLLILFPIVYLTGCTINLVKTDDPAITESQDHIRSLIAELIKEYKDFSELREKYPDAPEKALAVFMEEKRKKTAELVAEIVDEQRTLRALFATQTQRAELTEAREQEITEIRDKLAVEFEKRNQLFDQNIDALTAKELWGENYSIYARAQKTLADNVEKINKINDVIDTLHNKIILTIRKHNTKKEQVAKDPNCFSGETRVLLPGGQFKEIRQLKEGDAVLAMDRQSNQLIPRKISEFTRGRSDHYYILNGVLKMTAAHPVLTGDGQWVEVAELKVGMTIQGKEGTIPVQSIIRIATKNMQVFNFDVEGGDNYLVAGGERYYVVHNGK